ncbi:hypothetical protein D8674_024648 [Pyrus ussuriensis x Pyrus communis]|uniref:DUF4283 domain-containing protein n=1 Tax=Pyrus ussuriensis x Pyrus communis TaxID=2448454 RepID=A0A5N5H3H6_9ROSA|nr:hypothetical protein D8674_024648 [Pyrus ussuriensis x Pyrus communis]
MAANLQAPGTSFRHRRSISLPNLPSWVNPFSVPNCGQPPIVERGVTKVDTNKVSTMNVTLMKSRVLMGKMFRKSKDAKFIHKELALCGKECVKNTFFVDHFGNKWFIMQFTNEDEIDYVLENRSWYVKRESDQITYLRVWFKIPRIPMQFRTEKS